MSRYRGRLWRPSLGITLILDYPKVTRIVNTSITLSIDTELVECIKGFTDISRIFWSITWSTGG